jgi:hypothetical protein
MGIKQVRWNVSLIEDKSVDPEFSGIFLCKRPDGPTEGKGKGQVKMQRIQIICDSLIRLN